ncbi:MAG: helix-turn-helix transcriptional regulator [Planctomycetota bacterium]
MASRRARPSLQHAFGAALRACRVDRGLSQEELGHRSGAHRTYISELERGEKSATLSTIERLSLALETLPSALLAEAEALSGLDRKRS